MKNKPPNFIDLTVKEGGMRIHNCLLLDQVDEITHELESAGISYAEICHGKGIGGKEIGYPGLHDDRELLEAAKRRTHQLKLCVYIAPYDYSYSKIESLAPFFDVGRVGANVDEPEEAKKYLVILKTLGKKTIGQILRIHACPPKDCVETAKKMADWGAEVIYLTDSYGSLETDEIKKYIGSLKNSVPQSIGFQGKNNTGLAVANTIAAWQEGAEWLDGALLGMGQGAGNAPLEELIACFQGMGNCENIRLAELCNAGKFFVKPALRSLPMIQYLDLMMAQYKIDYYPQELLLYLANILDMELEDFLKELKNSRKNMTQLREEDIRTYLKTHRLDFDVVMNFLKTGEIPKTS